MKFCSLVLSLMASAAAAAKLTPAEIQRRLNAGEFDKSKVMKNAIPYNRALRSDRKLDQNNVQYNQYNQYSGQVYSNNNNNGGNNNNNNNNNQNNQDDDYAAFEITGDYRLQFNSCVSLTTQNYNLLLDNLVHYTQSGYLNSIRNYVLFDVCQVDNCYYDADNTDNTYMIELNSFIVAMIESVADDHENYCRACEENMDTCRPEDDAVQDEDGGRRRRLENNNNNNVVVLDCDQCEAMGCYDEQDQQEQEENQGDDANGNNQQGDDAEQYQLDYQEMAEWVQGMTECKQVGGYWNGLNLFAGWTCNSDGSGIEIGVFLDAYCHIHHSTLSYANMLGNYAEEAFYVEQSKSIVPLMFNKYIDCGEQEIEYVMDDNYQAENDNNNNGDGDDDEVPEASEICRRLFEGNDENGGSVPRLLSDCDGNGNNNADVQYEQNDDQYVEAQAAGDDNAAAAGDDNAAADANGNAYNDGKNTYYYDDSWYKFDISVDIVQDKAAICAVMANKFTSDEGIENVYDESSGGSLYDYNNGDKESLWDNYNPSSAITSASGVAPGTVLIIVFVAVALTVMFMSYISRKMGKKKKSDEIVVLGADHNKTPLIIT